MALRCVVDYKNEIHMITSSNNKNYFCLCGYYVKKLITNTILFNDIPTNLCPICYYYNNNESVIKNSFKSKFLTNIIYKISVRQYEYFTYNEILKRPYSKRNNIYNKIKNGKI